MWPKATQDNFRAFVGSDSFKRISEFTKKLQKWTASGAAAELAGYAVAPSRLISFRGNKSDLTGAIKHAAGST